MVPAVDGISGAGDDEGRTPLPVPSGVDGAAGSESVVEKRPCCDVEGPMSLGSRNEITNPSPKATTYTTHPGRRRVPGVGGRSYWLGSVGILDTHRLLELNG